jgi:predicted amidophosphoribosyltransferase
MRREVLDPYGHPVCSNCGADLRIDEGLHVCRRCADKLPWLEETQEKLAEVEKNREKQKGADNGTDR